MKLFLCSLLSLAALVAFSPSAADAAESGGIREANLYPFIQYFTWEEFGRDGSRLLKESGPQYGLGGNLKLNLVEGGAGAITLNSKTEIFGGVVDYNGKSQSPNPANNNRPLKTDVSYFGISEELDFGWAIPMKNIIVEPFSGVGLRWWIRDLHSSSSVNTFGATFPVSGYTENWYSLSSLIGVKGQYQLSKDVRFSLMGAAKYPFYNRNNVDPGGGEISLSPGSKWSMLTDAGITYNHLFAVIYYENFIFSKSPAISGSEQPRSESEITGIRVGWSFR